MIQNFLLGLLISFVVAFTAYRKKSLTFSGFLGACVCGTGMYATSGIFCFLLIFFFISSSLLSHYKKKKKHSIEEKFAKTANRDLGQVIANGSIPLAHSICYYFTSDTRFLILMAASISTANADTWATELGILNKSHPFSLRTFRRVDAGTSGAISLVGTFFSLIGALSIGAMFIFFLWASKIQENYFRLFILVSASGFLCALLDSFLGAFVQGVYWIEDEQKETEKKMVNGKSTKLIRGWAFFNNDLVNWVSILFSSIILLPFLVLL